MQSTLCSTQYAVHAIQCTVYSTHLTLVDPFDPLDPVDPLERQVGQVGQVFFSITGPDSTRTLTVTCFPCDHAFDAHA
jgi:hypothetical protein